MKSIIRRLMLVLKSRVNSLLSPAEDPRRVFAVAFQRQKDMLEKVRRAQENVVARTRQLEAKADGAATRLPRLEEQARQALLAHREEQARFALRLRLVAAEEHESLQGQVRELTQQTQALSLVEQRLTTEIEAFFARQELLAAQFSTAEAQVHIKEALGGVSEELADMGLEVERAEERTEEMQARASAIDSLIEAGILETPALRAGDQLGALLSSDDSDSEAIEEHLASLKKRLELA